MTKVEHILEMHKIYLLQFAGIDYYTVVTLIQAYMERFNIFYKDKNTEECFLKTAHDYIYFDEQHFAVLCAMYVDFDRVSSFSDRVLGLVDQQSPEIFPNHKAA
jgi:hypothetical protein